MSTSDKCFVTRVTNRDSVPVSGKEQLEIGGVLVTRRVSLSLSGPCILLINAKKLYPVSQLPVGQAESFSGKFPIPVGLDQHVQYGLSF